MEGEAFIRRIGREAGGDIAPLFADQDQTGGPQKLESPQQMKITVSSGV
ncbi:hypothetical protein U8C32_13275 [Sinorhizobium medicae]|nr:hypothetical protein [Sinorhizobium medicae]MDX0312748.1 hypothetical protein [Sinorhizobium meliloti]WQO64296.1 hypothetical protein U8C40_14170 [Sinorhizobium medicae]WQO71389.1 hypothetical protein U8C31_13910 [Sinorhizobium medicae]WQO90808.1 hypothetical protein U8C32_13275 [Sinorhizobium medicae]